MSALGSGRLVNMMPPQYPAFMPDRSVPVGLCVALYKGTRPGLDGIQNRMGRWLDAGPYSHAELVMTNRMSSSSSLMDKGVRTKLICYSSVGSWDFLPILDPSGRIEAKAAKWFADHDGNPYDLWGNVRFAFGMARDSKDKWFCSEAVMAALGFAEAFRYGPSGMAIILQDIFKTPIIEVNKK